MTKNELVELIKAHLNDRDGEDYYDYTGKPHWWAEEGELSALADTLLAAQPSQAPEKVDAAGRVLIVAAVRSGDEGAIRLALQLAGAAPCEACGYVHYRCRCAAPVAAQPSQAQAAEAVKPYARLVTFDEFVQYGKDHGANVVNGMPWSFSFAGHAVTHENDDLYMIGTPSIEFRRGEVLIATVFENRSWLQVLQPPASPVASNEREGLTKEPICSRDCATECEYCRDMAEIEESKPYFVSAVEKKRIAGIVHTDCTLIPGATFYNAAEIAIDATAALLAARTGEEK